MATQNTTPAPASSASLTIAGILHIIMTLVGPILATLPQTNPWVQGVALLVSLISAGNWSLIVHNLHANAGNLALDILKEMNSAATNAGTPSLVLTPGVGTTASPSFQPAPPAVPLPTSSATA